MERELNIPTTLMGGPPVREDMIKLGESQVSFMNIFALPLFESVTDILPAMQFSVDEILRNKSIWQKRVELGKQQLAPRTLSMAQVDGSAPSPLTRTGVDYFQSNVSPSEPETKIAYDSAQSTAPQKVIIDHPRKPSARGEETSPKSSFEQVTNLARSAGLHAGDAPYGLMASAQPAITGQATLHSRRSSKEAPLAPLNLGPLTTSDSHVSSSRRGSADASLTTILVTSKESSADTERPPTELPGAPLPEKTQSQPIISDANDPAGRTSVPSNPSAHSHATSSNTNTIPHSPSTQATSIFEGDSSALNGESITTRSPSFPPHEYHTTSLPHLPLREEKTGVVSAYGPDTAQNVPGADDNHALRSRSSRTGLRGLKFWKDLRRWKSPSPINQSGTNQVQ